MLRAFSMLLSFSMTIAFDPLTFAGTGAAVVTKKRRRMAAIVALGGV